MESSAIPSGISMCVGQLARGSQPDLRLLTPGGLPRFALHQKVRGLARNEAGEQGNPGRDTYSWPAGAVDSVRDAIPNAW